MEVRPLGDFEVSNGHCRKKGLQTKNRDLKKKGFHIDTTTSSETFNGITAEHSPRKQMC